MVGAAGDVWQPPLRGHLTPQRRGSAPGTPGRAARREGGFGRAAGSVVGVGAPDGERTAAYGLPAPVPPPRSEPDVAPGAVRRTQSHDRAGPGAARRVGPGCADRAGPGAAGWAGPGLAACRASRSWSWRRRCPRTPAATTGRCAAGRWATGRCHRAPATHASVGDRRLRRRRGRVRRGVAADRVRLPRQTGLGHRADRRPRRADGARGGRRDAHHPVAGQRPAHRPRPDLVVARRAGRRRRTGSAGS